MPVRAIVLIRCVLNATKAILKHFRPGESLESWYTESIQKRLRDLSNLQINIQGDD